MSCDWPIVVVTGANAGVGFGICHRLLIQLLQKHPSDAQPQFEVKREDRQDGHQGLTLIMACRSVNRADAARKRLHKLLDSHIQQLVGKEGWLYADTFRRNVKIEIHYLDLALVSSVFKFGEEVLQKYPYISHLICNAGVASFTGIDWPICIKQLITRPMSAVTAPEFNLQSQGERSVDDLGWVWQCNVFGHYVLYRTLQPLLQSYKSTATSRVIWMSSLEAIPKFYVKSDYQLLNTDHAYEATKYQMDLLGTQLDHGSRASQSRKIRHFVVQPGVCSTNISIALVGAFLQCVKVVLFYLARLAGSPHHTIKPFKAAISAVHIALVPLFLIPTTFSVFTPDGSGALPPATDGKVDGSRPVRFGSETGRWGEERVGVTEVKEWQAHREDAVSLVNKCETLYQSFLETEGTI